MSKQGQKIYNTKRWKELRQVVLAEEPTCHWCKRARATEVDHLQELAAGGDPYDRANLVGACKSCNARRGTAFQNRQAAQRRASAFGSAPTSTPPPTALISRKSGPDQGRCEPGPARPSQAGPIPPRLVTKSHGLASYGPSVVDWARRHLDLELYPWQQQVLSGALEHRNGELLHRWGLVSTARQNGKTAGLLAPLIGWWLTDGRRARGGPQYVLSSAHKLKLAEDTARVLFPILEEKFGFNTFVSAGRFEAQHDDGSRWKIEAANGRAGHGTSNDLVVCDEIWNIDSEVIEAGLLPTQRARPNPFALFVSTAGDQSSEFMQRWRERGLQQIESGEAGRLYFAEWSPPADALIDDRSVWPMANPALNLGALTLQDLEDEFTQPDRDQFVRMALNMWTAAANGWLQPGVWDALQVDDPMPADGVLAVDSANGDGRYVGVRVARRGDGRLQVHTEFSVEASSAMWDEIAALLDEHRSVQLILTPGLAAVCPRELQHRMMMWGQQEITKYAALVHGMILEGQLVHTGQMSLGEQVNRAVPGPVNGGASFTLSSVKSPGPIEMCRCMVAAAGLAAKPVSNVRKPMIGTARA